MAAVIRTALVCIGLPLAPSRGTSAPCLLCLLWVAFSVTDLAILHMPAISRCEGPSSLQLRMLLTILRCTGAFQAAAACPLLDPTITGPIAHCFSVCVPDCASLDITC